MLKMYDRIVKFILKSKMGIFHTQFFLVSFYIYIIA